MAKIVALSDSDLSVLILSLENISSKKEFKDDKSVKYLIEKLKNKKDYKRKESQEL